MAGPVRAALATALLLGGGAADVPTGPVGHGYRSSRDWLLREPVVTSPTGVEMVADFALPRSWDWRSVNGRSFVTSDVNQHIPQYCGSCWIHGTTAALNDRVKVMRNAAWPDAMLGRQALMNCVPGKDGQDPPGCNGGDSWMIHKYLLENRVPDETCMPYQARNMGCAPENVCRNCAPEHVLTAEEVCYPVDGWTGYGVSEYGNVTGEVAMMKEIYARGPIACSAATDLAFMLNYSANAKLHEGVYVTDQKFTDAQVDHVIEVAGWGETPSGVKYWVARNSWGTYWGEMGWFRVRRGVNQMLIEESCDWAVPTFKDLNQALRGVVMGDYVRGVQPLNTAVPLPPLGAASLPPASGPAVAPAGLAAMASPAGTSSWLAAFAGFAAALGMFAALAPFTGFKQHLALPRWQRSVAEPLLVAQ